MHLPISVTQDELLEVFASGCAGTAGLYLGCTRHRKIRVSGKIRRRSRPAVRVAPRKPARAGGYHWHSADPGRDIGIPSAEK